MSEQFAADVPFDAAGAALRKNPPRVLLVGSALGGGGAETRFRLLATNMFEGSSHVAVLHNGGKEQLKNGQAVHELGWAGGRSYPKMLGHLRRVIRASRFDAILSLGLYPNTLAWAATRALGQQPALIMTEITRPDTESRLGHPIRHWLTHAVRRVSFPAADLLAANSEDGREEVVRHYHVDPARIRRIPNLVEPERLSVLAAAHQDLAPADGARFCVATRLVGMKRIDTILEAAAGLSREPAWAIDIVGDGPERAALADMAIRLGIAERICFHGWLKNPYPIMRRSTALVLASVYEGFSNTVLEAMALGTPVITSFCSSDARLLSEEGTALGFPVGDTLTLRAHMQRVLSDPDLRSQLAMRARQSALRHTLPNAIPEYEALVLDAIDWCARQRRKAVTRR